MVQTLPSFKQDQIKGGSGYSVLYLLDLFIKSLVVQAVGVSVQILDPLKNLDEAISFQLP